MVQGQHPPASLSLVGTRLRECGWPDELPQHAAAHPMMNLEPDRERMKLPPRDLATVLLPCPPFVEGAARAKEHRTISGLRQAAEKEKNTKLNKFSASTILSPQLKNSVLKRRRRDSLHIHSAARQQEGPPSKSTRSPRDSHLPGSSKLAMLGSTWQREANLSWIKATAASWLRSVFISSSTAS